MANLTPRPSQCPDCRGGRIGLDSCDKCAGTGTVFRINGKYFADTAEGYKAAEAELFSGAASGAALLARDFDCRGVSCGVSPCICGLLFA